ncbi:hypothetical protein BN938_2373 [Mucinivorans hirudinis]|uniref:Uncharacterized protein n=1 Tax=Mucinivorans hirudinis TaxID=1433126 RepID=A0A060RE72_9BACT|nr:hypothetical protein BN938_2373 [Mucinivorans hirudinis]
MNLGSQFWGVSFLPIGVQIVLSGNMTLIYVKYLLDFMSGCGSCVTAAQPVGGV